MASHGGKRTGSGRKKSEPTVRIRVPESKLEAVQALLDGNLPTSKPTKDNIPPAALYEFGKRFSWDIRRSWIITDSECPFEHDSKAKFVVWDNSEVISQAAGSNWREELITDLMNKLTELGEMDTFENWFLENYTAQIVFFENRLIK